MEKAAVRLDIGVFVGVLVAVSAGSAFLAVVSTLGVMRRRNVHMKAQDQSELTKLTHGTPISYS